jgi:HSP20 family protein
MAGVLRRREGQQNENREMARQTQGPDPFQWDPFRSFGSIDPFRRMREMLNVDPFAEMASGFPSMGRGFVPDMAVCEKSDCYVVSADLPGLAADDLNVEVTGNRLTISGKRDEEQRNEGERYWTYERSFGHFTRSFVLPAGTLPDELEARLNNGVLEVRIPKVKAEEAKRIPVKGPDIGQTQIQSPMSATMPQTRGGSTSSPEQRTTQTGTIGSTGQESLGGAREKAA